MFSIYVVKDKKLDGYGLPVNLPNNEIARRKFSQVANEEKESELYRYPQDFELLKIGTYDEDKGIITPLAQPEKVIEIQDLKIDIKEEKK